MSEQLRVVVANPGEDARAAEIPSDYRGMIDAVIDTVGGFPARLQLTECLVAYVHEDSILEALPWNRQLGPLTYVAGPLLVLGRDPHAWRHRSLTPLEEADALRLLNSSVPRLDHTRGASISELASWTGERVLWFTPLDHWLGQVA
jgi:hypothetical protein